MAQKLNTSTSVVDYIKSTGGDSSFTARAKKAVELGIVKSTSQYTGDANQNTSLLKALQGSTPKSPSKVGNMDDASRFINAEQENDRSKKKNEEAAPTRKKASETLTEAFEDITGSKSILPDIDVPDVPNFTQTYNQLRQKYNLDQLESTLNDLDAEEQLVRAAKRERLQLEEDKPVATNVIAGRQSEVERQENKRLESLAVQKQGIANQLATANAVIENTMNLKKLDYSTAKEAYDSKFSQNIQMFNLVKGLYDADVTEEERESDNARANLQIIYDNLKESGDLGNVSEDLKYTITKLELSAGLPSGFYERIAASKPEADILSTTTRTSGGVKYADILYKNKDGSLTTSSVRLGATTEGSGSDEPSESELARGARSTTASALESVAQNGYVTPDDYKKARSAWVKSGFEREEFDNNFAAEYLNPDDYTTAGVDYVFY